MDNSTLSLVSYSHLFEIFTGYYLLLGTNQNFRNYFDVSRLFDKWNDKYSEIEQLTKRLEQMEDELIRGQAPQLHPVGQTSKERLKLYKHWLGSQRRNADSILQMKRKAYRTATIGKKLGNQIRLHFNEKESENKETKFYRFIKPFYIYFGTLSLAIILLAGSYNEWERFSTLNIINGISFCVYLLLIFEVVRNWFYPPKLNFFDPIKTLIGSVAFFVIIELLPKAWCDRVYIMNYPISEETFKYSNFQVIFIATLILLPIITHITILSLIIYRHERFLYTKNKIDAGFEKINEPQIIRSGNIPEFPDPPQAN